MPRNDYLPVREDQLPPWFANFSSKLTGYQVLLGLTLPEVNGVIADSLLVDGVLNAVEAIKQESKETIAFKNIELYGPATLPTPPAPTASVPFAISPRPAGILIRTRAMVARIKASPNYNEAIGQDLGIIGSEIAPGGPVKPQCSVSATGSFQATIEFTKNGHDSVEIESRRGAETVFSFLATDSYTPYVDNRPPLIPGQAENRSYRLRYIDRDSPVGVYSDIISVAVGA